MYAIACKTARVRSVEYYDTAMGAYQVIFAASTRFSGSTKSRIIVKRRKLFAQQFVVHSLGKEDPKINKRGVAVGDRGLLARMTGEHPDAIAYAN